MEDEIYMRELREFSRKEAERFMDYNAHLVSETGVDRRENYDMVKCLTAGQKVELREEIREYLKKKKDVMESRGYEEGQRLEGYLPETSECLREPSTSGHLIEKHYEKGDG